METALIALAIKEAPAAIDLLKTLFKRDNPDAAEPTNEQVIAAWNSAFVSSLAKDAAWLKVHPA